MHFNAVFTLNIHVNEGYQLLDGKNYMLCLLLMSVHCFKTGLVS